MTAQAVYEKVDRLFEQFTQPGSPGCALGVMKDGEMVYKQGYGLANLEYDIPITPSTIFPIASMSKQFATMAVALLTAAGQLSLDDDVRKYLPEVPDFGATITTRHLVHHTSGLRSEPMLLWLAGWRLEDVITNADVMELARMQRDLNFQPGEQYSYCGTGYAILASLVEQVSGQSLAEFCKEQIFEPLDMINTHFHDDYLRVVKNRAYAYYPAGDDHYKNAVLTCSLVGGTGLYTTVEDLALWDENFYSGQVGGQSVIEQMHQRGVLNNGEEIDYAFGLIWDTYKGMEVIAHSGGGPGIHSYMMRFPERHFSVVVLGNCDTVNAQQLVRQVAGVYLAGTLEDAPTTTDVPEILELEETQLLEKVGTYYDVDSAAFVDVELQDGKLQIWGRDLLPVGENSFFIPNSPFTGSSAAQAVFIPATESEPTQIQIDTGIIRLSYAWVEPVPPTPDYQRAYTGRYYSPEIDVYWTITLEGDELVVHRKRQGSSPLIPMLADVFTNDWLAPIIHTPTKPHALAFYRDENNAVSGFRISDAGARLRNLRFVKTH